MALIPAAHKALSQYVEKAAVGGAINGVIVGAVVLTPAQQKAVSDILTAFWNRQYLCPKILDIVPRHGYQSRVVKDGFSGEQFVEWLVAGCSDAAGVSADFRGRPRLHVRNVRDDFGVDYDILVLIGSDTHGRVNIFDVIPKGLDPP